MGNYYAIHTGIKLKPNTPKEIVDVFEWLYCLSDVFDHDEVKFAFDMQPFVTENKLSNYETYSCVVRSRSSYHETYRHRGKFLDGMYYSFSSSKDNPEKEFKALLELIFDHLDVKHGDILYRWVHEDFHVEQVLWANTETRKIVHTVGHEYSTQEGTYLCDSSHPWNQTEKDYPIVHYRNYFDLVGKVARTFGIEHFVNLIKK